MMYPRTLLLLAISCMLASCSAQSFVNCSAVCDSCRAMCNCTLSTSCCTDCCEVCYGGGSGGFTAGEIAFIACYSVFHIANVAAVVVYVRRTSMPMYEAEWKKYAPIGMAVIALLMSGAIFPLRSMKLICAKFDASLPAVMAWVVICVVTRQVKGVLGFLKPKIDFFNKMKSSLSMGAKPDDAEMSGQLQQHS